MFLLTHSTPVYVMVSIFRMRLLLLLFFLLSTAVSWRSRRLRRQFLPSQHVQVHSIDSGVTVDGTVFVESGENRIDFDEQYINGSLWSDHSLLNFDNQDTFSNVSADNSEALFNLQGHIQVHSQGLKGDFFVHTNRSTDGHSAIDHHVFGAANFSFDDGVMKVQGVGGKRVGMEAQTWDRDMERTITLEATTLPSGERELRLEANGKPYHAVICFEGAVVYFQYAGKFIKLDPSYRFIEISTDKYTVTVKTENAPFHVSLAKNEIVILLPKENTRVCVYVDGVAVQSSQLTKTHIDRNGGRMTIGGKPVAADGVMITALNTDLDMSNGGKVDSNTQNSFLMMESNMQPVGLTARHHNLKINDGIPHITIDPGLSIVEIQTNHGVFSLQNLMAPFRPREDKFVDIGPFRVMTSQSSYGPPRTIPPPPLFPPPSMLPPPMPFQEQGPPPIPELAAPPPHPPGMFGGAVAMNPPLPFNGVHHGMPAFAADLPPVLGGSSVKTTTILEKTTNITTVSSTHEGAKKKGIKLDPMLALAMAADLPPVIRPDTKITSTTEATVLTSTRRSHDDNWKNVTTMDEQPNLTTIKTDKSKGIPLDSLLVKAMAADLPPAIPQLTQNNNIQKFLNETISAINSTSFEQPGMANSLGSSTRNGSEIFDKINNNITISTKDPLDIRSSPPALSRGSTSLGINETASLPLSAVVNNSKIPNPGASAGNSMGGSSKTTTVVEKLTNITTVSTTEQDQLHSAEKRRFVANTTNGSLEKMVEKMSNDSSNATATTAEKLANISDRNAETETKDANHAKETEDQRSKQIGHRSGQTGSSSVKTTSILKKTTNITEVNTLHESTQKLDGNLSRFVADLPPVSISTTRTTALPVITTTTPITSTTVITTPIPTTTTSTPDPLEELKKLREEMTRMKQIREWEEREVSQGGDGDEHVEEFTFPNGTTVHRVVKTRRRITTTVTHKHREEVNGTDTTGTAVVSSRNVDLSKTNFTLKGTSTTVSPADEEFFKTDTPPQQTLIPGILRGFRGKVTLAPTIRKTSVTRTFEIPAGA